MDFDDYESLPASSTVGTHMVAGAASGILEHCFMYPIDSVKVCCCYSLLCSLLLLLGLTVFHGKLCQIPRASSQNSATPLRQNQFKFRGSLWPFVCVWTEFYPAKKLQLLKAGNVLSYASNIQRKLFIFFFKSIAVKLCLHIYDCVPYCDGYL